MKREIIANGNLFALRTNRVTGEERTVELGWSIRRKHLEGRTVLEEKKYVAETWLYLEGGPTGHESIRLGDWEEKDLLQKEGWSACAGTPNRYDRLFVPIDEIRRVLDEVYGKAEV